MEKVLKICVATNNDHKMGELKDIFKDLTQMKTGKIMLKTPSLKQVKLLNSQIFQF